MSVVAAHAVRKVKIWMSDSACCRYLRGSSVVRSLGPCSWGLSCIVYQRRKLWRGVMVALRNSRSRKCNVNTARMAAFALVIAFGYLVCSPMNRLRRIEDSHHRLCAVYTFDEDAINPCKIV